MFEINIEHNTVSIRENTVTQRETGRERDEGADGAATKKKRAVRLG